MSATNSTTHYNLPSFIGSDKPAWLVDWNGAMAAIDAAIYEAKQTADTASSGVSTVSSDLATLASTVTTQGTSISTISDSLTTLVGTVNTVTALIGNGEPTTTDKTIIGAINELHSDITSGGGGGSVSIAASNITYSNTTSGLVATNAQSAIDELKSDIDAIIDPATATRRYIIVGDSFGTASDSVNFVVKLQALLGASNDNFFNLSKHAVGFTRKADNMNCLEYLQSQESNVTDPSTITDIIVTVGVNDTLTDNSASQLTNVNATITYLKTTYPNAKIHYSFIGNIVGSTDTTNDMVDYYFNMLQITTKAFRDAGCYIINGLEYVMHDALNSGSDNIHPNEAGATELSKFIYEYLKGLNPKYQRQFKKTTSTGKIVLITIDGGLLEARFINFGSDQSGTGTGAYETLFDLSDTPLRGIHATGRNSPLWSLIATASGDIPVSTAIRDSTLTAWIPAVTYTAIRVFKVTMSTLDN